MMDYGYGHTGGGMWVFGGLMMLVLIGVVIWAVLTLRHRPNPMGMATDGNGPSAAAGRVKVRQILDERYARGEITAEEYTERLRTLGC